jgi:peptidoglycan-associated lipoprotein
VRAVFSILTFIFFFSNSFAQKNFYKAGMEAYRKGQYYLAIDCFKKYYSKSSDKEGKVKALFIVGDCYYKLYDYRQAETYLSKAIKAKYPDPYVFLLLMLTQKEGGKYDEAINTFEEYKKRVPDAGNDFSISCENAKKWLQEPLAYTIENMAMINSKSRDMLPVFGRNLLTIYLSSTRANGNSDVPDACTGEPQSDIYFTRKDTSRGDWWSNPLSTGEFINSVFNENSVCCGTAHHGFYFSRMVKDSRKKNSAEHLKLFYADSTFGKYNARVLDFCFTDTGNFNFDTPFLCADGETLFFSSDMPGGYGGYDLWSVKWNSKEKHWEQAVNLGPRINSEADERSPFLFADILYFSSNNYKGMGGYDIYSSVSGEDAWGKPQNMQYPINSPQDDISIVFEGNKDQGYICSNREGGKGSFDIWKFTPKH